MAANAHLHDDDMQSADGHGEVEDGEREDDSSESGDGEIDSESEDDNEDVVSGNRPEIVESPVIDDSDAPTEEFVDSEPKSPSGMSNISNGHVMSADDIGSDEENHENTSLADQSALSPMNISGLNVPTVVSPPLEDQIRKPIKIEYSESRKSDSEAIIRSPSIESEGDMSCSFPNEPTRSPVKNQDVSAKSPIATTETSNPQIRVSPTPPSPITGPESMINSPSVGFESLSPQSMMDDDYEPESTSGGIPDGSAKGESKDNGSEAPPKSIPNQSLEDQEGELDFEEETPEERRDVATEVPSKHKKITMGKTEKTEKLGSSQVDKSEDKEEGEEGDDGEDDGELEDDDDLEEGEVKESTTVRKIQPKPICRFYSKGQCTWGSACRFLHPGVNDKGNYNMFAPAKPLALNNSVLPGSSPYVWPARPAVSPTFGSRAYVEPVPLPLPPPPPPPPPPAHFEEPVRESAWERGLRHAKEILRKSTKRKELEPDFEEKRMNLSIGGTDAPEYEKENEYYNRSSPFRHVTAVVDTYRTSYGYDEAPLDPYERQAHDYWRGGNYENFEVRYTRNDYPYRVSGQQDRSRLKEREIDHRDARNRERERDLYREPPPHDRERVDRSRKDNPERGWRDDRYSEHQPTQSRSGRGDRGDEWCDPWRRSTSPKRRNRSRSFSSHSSVSYSSSGHSSGSHTSSYSSHSRSSSASSNSSYSSRSYSPTRVSHEHHPQHHPHQHPVPHSKPPPPRERSSKFPAVGISSSTSDVHRRPKPLPPGGHVPPQPSSGSRLPAEKRPTVTQVHPAIATQPQQGADRRRPQKPVTTSVAPKVAARRRSLSTSGSDSYSSRSRSRSSRSGSSRSCSSSGSSLVSVSSKSSASSKSSYNSGQNISTLDALKREERRVRERERLRTAEVGRRQPAASSSGAPDRERDRTVRESRDSKSGDAQVDRVKSLVNTPRTSKDPLRQTGQKPQIKLTLLNKAPPADKASAAPPPVRKLVADVRKPKPATAIAEKEPSKPIKAGAPPIATNTRKRPLPSSPSRGGPDASLMAKASSSRGSSAASSKAPSISAAAAAAAALLNKKSTSSRREELLKQLKAVEDAIARKRAKFT